MDEYRFCTILGYHPEDRARWCIQGYRVVYVRTLALIPQTLHVVIPLVVGKYGQVY